MPLPITSGASTLVITRQAYERVGLVRAAIDSELELTPDEFRVEGDLVVIGPVYSADALANLVPRLEELGIEYYDEMFELSGNWPEWLKLFASSAPGAAPASPER